MDEIANREQCTTNIQIGHEMKEMKVDHRQRLTKKAIKHIEQQILEKYRAEKLVKGFTNEDDTKSKIIYETISRTNDAGYFKYLHGIKDSMSNLDVILRYSRDPYSYMLHKNRRLLIKMLSTHKQQS